MNKKQVLTAAERETVSIAFYDRMFSCLLENLLSPNEIMNKLTAASRNPANSFID